MMNKQSITAAVFCIAGVLTSVSHAAPLPAIPLYNSGGFESDRFVAGAVLEGQDALQGPWLVTNTPNPAAATVELAVGRAGTQGVRLSNSGGKSNTQWFVSKPNTPVFPYNSVSVTWDQSTAKTTNAGLTFGPFFGVESYDAASSPGVIKQIGAFGVDATTGNLLVLVGTGGGGAAFAPLLTPMTVPFSQYQSLGMSIHYDTKTYTVTLNGTPLETDPFIDSTAIAFTDAPISTRFVGNNGQNSANSGVAFFDNYAISLIPEPVSAAATGFFLLGMFKRRR